MSAHLAFQDGRWRLVGAGGEPLLNLWDEPCDSGGHQEFEAALQHKQTINSITQAQDAQITEIKRKAGKS